jgi:hypothetical protein
MSEISKEEVIDSKFYKSLNTHIKNLLKNLDPDIINNIYKELAIDMVIYEIEYDAKREKN